MSLWSRGGGVRKLTNEELANPALLNEEDKLLRRTDLTSQHRSNTGRSEPYEWNGTTFTIKRDRQWIVSHEGLDRLAKLGRLQPTESGGLHWKLYEDEVPGRRINNLWEKTMSASDLHYVVETAPSTIERCILMATEPGDLVMDITGGGGTTALVAERWGRRWITTDTSGVANAIARQRLLAAHFDWYHLQQSEEGRMKEAELSGKSTEQLKAESEGHAEGDPAGGFVYERVPRVSAAILAYDQEVDPILLVNKPIRKRGVVRVASPFTVESHSPGRYISASQAAASTQEQIDTRERIVDALPVTGIQSGDGKLQIEEVEDWGEPSLVTHQAVSVDEEGKRTASALAIAPDDQTAGSEFITHAANDAAGRGLSQLIVLAFAFEPSSYKREEQRGKLRVLRAQINRDFQIRGLENRADDHAFVMIGQPDVDVHDEGDGMVSVEVKGYDTFNPTTGNVHRGQGAEIDCWMVDTHYDGRVFNARRVHFPNGKDDTRLKRLKSKLKRWIDEDQWEAMASMRTSPFPKPRGEQARIAVRIVTRTALEMTVEVSV